MLRGLRRKLREVASHWGDGLFSSRSGDFERLFELLRPVHTGRPLTRIGGHADGGYLLPDDFEGLRHCFSPGVAEKADLELVLAERGVKCFLADYSVDRAPVDHPNVEFDKKFLGKENAGPFMTLQSWVDSKGVSGDDMLLQMDIEGYEYDVLLSTPESTLRRFRIIAIEFHGLQKLSKPRRFAIFQQVCEKLAKDFVVVHMHPNNYAPPVVIRGVRVPPLMEITFLRKDRALFIEPRSDFPHALDQPNLSDRPDTPLPHEWFSPRG